MNPHDQRSAALDLTHHGELPEHAIEQIVVIYREAYKELLDNPFDTVERFLERLHNYASAPGFECVIGTINDEPVGCLYGYPLPPNARWWRGLLSEVDPATIEETGQRTFALCDLMVRPTWRKQGVSDALHRALLNARHEDRATLLVDETHPKVRALYERYGYRYLAKVHPFPDAPIFDAMVLDPLKS